MSEGEGGQPPPLPRIPTLWDVAARAGVSVMTASIVANGRAGRVSAVTRQRVEAAVTELRYRPNANARGLRLAKGWSVGMVVLDASPRFLAAPFTTHVVAGLSNRLGEHGYALTLQGLAPAQAEQALAFRSTGTDGLCVLPAGTRAERRRFLEALRSLDMPTVIFDEALDASLADGCTIGQDNRGGGRLLAEHVLGAGARHLLMLVPDQDWPSVEERRAGIAEAVRARGRLAQLRILRCGDESLAATRDTLRQDLARHGRPDAVLAGNDQMGIAALQALREAGWQVPAEVMVTGFNGFAFRDYSDPLLTSVRSAAYEMGAAGADALLARLATGTFPARRICLPVALLPGESTRRPAIG